MKILLEALQNNVKQKNICGGLKVTVVLIGGKEALRNSVVSYSFAVVTLQPNITSSVTGNQERL